MTFHGNRVTGNRFAGIARVKIGDQEVTVCDGRIVSKYIWTDPRTGAERVIEAWATA